MRYSRTAPIQELGMLASESSTQGEHVGESLSHVFIGGQ